MRTKSTDALSLAVVYQDALMLDWAMEQCKRVEWLRGVLDAQSTWWKTRHLNNPELLVAAVLAAQAADIIMVAVPAFENPPADIERWTQGWLTCRSRSEGSLIGLIGTPESASILPARTREYWWAVAAQAHLEYEAYERPFPT